MENVPADKVEKLAAFWKEGSDESFQTAHEIFTKTNKYMMVLFNLHLSVEKALKSQIVKKRGTFAPFTHNLVHLVSILDWAPSEDFVMRFARLSEYNLSTRYPEDKVAIQALASKELAANEIQSTQEILQWIFSH